MNIEQNAIRHGEVLLLPVDSMPDVEQVYEGNKWIVGHSETHHHHVAIGSGKALTVFKPVGADTTDIYLRVNKQSRLEHLKTFDKHETKTLNEGLYLVRPKNEFDPFVDLIRQVRD